jgi:hypothetical protein
MELLRSKLGDAIGTMINYISFRNLIRALRALSGLKYEECNQNSMNDEASAIFTFKGIKFEIHTPVSDYRIDKPPSCPNDIFEKIVQCLVVHE